MNMKFLGAVSVVSAMLVVPQFANAGFDDKNPITYTVDGATAAGYFKVVTEALNGIVRDVYPGTAATYQPGSPAGGLQKISTGQADFIFTAGGPEIGYALEGKAPFQESLKGKFKYVGVLHNDLVVYALMTKEWSEKHGIKSFADIAAKKPPTRLAVNTTGNLQSTIGMYVSIFETYGINEKDITSNGGSLFRGNSNSGLEAMRDGKIDLFINGGFVPAADVTDIARGRELLWVSSDKDKATAAGARWGYSPFTVKAGVYPFVTKDEYTHTMWTGVMAGTHVSDETVYKFVKALAENKDKVRTIHPSLAAFDIKDVSRDVTGGKVPYHPGAERYYRELGILK
jgi:TRAP transporter TAXI family solute receptor